MSGSSAELHRFGGDSVRAKEICSKPPSPRLANTEAKSAEWVLGTSGRLQVEARLRAELGARPEAPLRAWALFWNPQQFLEQEAKIMDCVLETCP